MRAIFEQPVELPDGRTVGSWSEEYRDACEVWKVKHLQEWQKKRYLEGVEKHRGPQGRKTLEEKTA